MEEILQRCIALDTAAQETYRQLAGLCIDPELKRLFERMSAEEWSHVEWWKELLDAYESGRIPTLADEVVLAEAIAETEQSVGRLLEVRFEDLDTEAMLDLAVRMEFFMLDPAFGELIEMLDIGAATHHREAYSRHVLRLVRAIETRVSDRGLASFLARVLARSFRDQERLAALATRDPLTALLNRRGFYNYLSQWCAWAQRYGHSLGVLLIDVDHFKSVNDTFGHPTGDAALCTVAEALRDAVRDSDLVGRYGGDEFAVLAPEASAEALEMLAKRVISSVHKASVALPNGAVRLTVSVGAAYLLKGAPATPEALLAAADHSLYDAKEAGRDRAAEPIDVSGITEVPAE